MCIRDSASIVSDAVESVIAAAYMDGGFSAARGIIDRLILGEKPSGKLLITDFKTELQELVPVSYTHLLPRLDAGF